MALLDTLDSPADLKKLSSDQLPALADEIRMRILDTVSEGRGRRPALLVYPELLRVAGSRAANLVDHR